jgi:phage baseplate assembly protein W
VPFVRFPFQVDASRNVADSDDPVHVRELIEELLLVSPGERVNRPDFGCPLIERVFGPESMEVEATTQTMVQTSLRQWLGTLIQVLAVDVSYQGEEMIVTVSYVDKASKKAQQVRVVR